MEPTVFLLASWVGVTLLSMGGLHSCTEARLERKELVLSVIVAIFTVVPGTIYTADYIANHWSHVSIPIPQANATSSGYITVRIPRVVPALSSPMSDILVGLFFLGVIAGSVFVIYDEMKSRESLELEPATLVIEAVESPTLEAKLRAFIEADRAVFNVSGIDYNDEVKIRARASQLNILAAEAKGILGSSMNIEGYIVNPDILMREPRLADGHMKEIATKLLGKVREHERKSQAA